MIPARRGPPGARRWVSVSQPRIQGEEELILFHEDHERAFDLTPRRFSDPPPDVATHCEIEDQVRKVMSPSQTHTTNRTRFLAAQSPESNYLLTRSLLRTSRTWNGVFP